MIHQEVAAGQSNSPDLKQPSLDRTSKPEVVKALAEGATSVADLAERASHALDRVASALTWGGDSAAAYERHQSALSSLWQNYHRASVQGGCESVEGQIAREREEFAVARAITMAQRFVALDRALSEVLGILREEPGAASGAIRINDLRDSLAVHAKDAADDFSKIIGGLGSTKDSGYELAGRLRRVEEQRWGVPVWGVFSEVSYEIRHLVGERIKDIVQTAVPEVKDGCASSLIKLLKDSPAYSDGRFSAFVHHFAGSERILLDFDNNSLRPLAALQHWAIKAAGMAAVDTGEVSLPLSALGRGARGDRYSYFAACEALADFARGTNAVFDRTQGHGSAGNLSLDKVMAAREACVRDLVREVNAQLSNVDRDAPRWGDPYQPLAALTSFGCQGLAATIEIARQNPWRADYVREVFKALRTVSDPHLGERYLDALESTSAAAVAKRVRSEGVALCRAHIDREELRHEAVWTLIHLAPRDEATRDTVRALLSSDDGCREIQLIEQYKDQLGISANEIAPARERYRRMISPR